MPSCSDCGIFVPGNNFKRRTCFDCKTKRRRLRARRQMDESKLTQEIVYVQKTKPTKIKDTESLEAKWQRLLRSGEV